MAEAGDRREVHVALREWERLRPGPGDAEKALAGFRFRGALERALARRLTDARVLEIEEKHDGLHLRARAHVGRLHIGRLTVTIQPKIGGRELLTLFRYAHGLKHIERHRWASYATAGALFFDLVIEQLHHEARALLERGLALAYVRRAEALATPRGRIDFVELAHRGGIRSAELPCVHHPRSSDHLLNRVLVSGLALAHRMAADSSLKKSVGRLHARASTLAVPCTLSARLLTDASRSVHRLLAPYASVVELIEILYSGHLDRPRWRRRRGAPCLASSST